MIVYVDIPQGGRQIVCTTSYELCILDRRRLLNETETWLSPADDGVHCYCLEADLRSPHPFSQ